ncbi:MAG: hypothetical protein R3C12_01795 [Planctomycetaceae bacterium]
MDIREEQALGHLACHKSCREHYGMAQEINVLALVKDNQRYVFLYDDASHDQLLQTLGRYAADPELNFSWYDAAVMSQRVRALRKHYSQNSGPLPHTSNSRLRDAA